MARAIRGSTPANATATSRLLALWRNPTVRGIIWQILVVGAVLAVVGYLVDNTLTNLHERRIRTGFSFLGQEAGFAIGESVIPFGPHNTYARAFLVGVLNTLQVAGIGVVLASIIGVASSPR